MKTCTWNRIVQLYIAFVLLGSTALAQTDDTFCWKQNYTRGVGGVATACQSGYVKDQDGLCYPACPSGYNPVGPLCWQTCPSGFTDIGVSCQKPGAIHTPGYGWQVGDALNLDGARGRCERDWGSGNCYQSGLLYYARCPANYSKFGDDICTPNCPSGMRDDGAYCAKQTQDRGVGKAPSCGSGMQEDAGLCYPQCGQGFTGIGPVCWGQCPANRPAQCGAACATSDAACATAIGDMTLNTTAVALNALSFAFGGPGVGAALKTAAKAGQNASSRAILNATSRSLDDLIRISAKAYAKAYAKEFVKSALKNKFSGRNLYWMAMKSTNTGTLKAMNTAATEFGVLKDSNAFDLSALTAVDITGISSMVLAFTKYGSCSGEDLIPNPAEVDFGGIGAQTIERTVLITAQQPMTVTRITSPAFSNCSIRPTADCVGKTLQTGQTCTIRVSVSAGAALDSELRIYTNAYSTIPYPVRIAANTGLATQCTEVPGVEEAVNLTSIAGVWAFDGDQTRKVLVQSTGSVSSWTGLGMASVQDAPNRLFRLHFGSYGPAWLLLNESNDRLTAATEIRAQHSGKGLDVSAGSSQDGAVIDQWDYTAQTHQRFYPEALGDGTYRIVAAHSGKVLDVEGGSTASGARIIQWTWHGGPNQRFRIEGVGSGAYRIVNVHSGKVLDVAGASSANGAQILQWDWTNGTHQRFTLSLNSPAIRRPWDTRCNPGYTWFVGACYDVPPGYEMTTPGIMGKPCPADWRDDGTNCWPPWKGVYVSGQADPEGSFTMRHPIVVTDCSNYSALNNQSCPSNFKNTGGPAGCSCEAVPQSKDIKTVTGWVPLR